MDSEKKNDNQKKRWHRRRRHNRPHEQKNPANQAEPVAVQEIEDAIPTESAAPIPTLPAEEIVAEEGKKLPVVGVRFRPAGKTYSFDPVSYTLMVGDPVVVETSQGQELGTVSAACRMLPEKDLILPLKKILRPATEKDLARYEENKALELSARKTFLEKAAEHKLDMALSDVECSFDKSKLVFYFTSEGRVDFREFVKDMAGIFKTRIELRQIGVRDEAKQLGGLGICGRPLCCSSFLDDFQQVSIKMAKEQNLSLNPTKISGTCGRLMCCLRYENEVYVEAAKRCPRADSLVMTPQGRGVVIESNLLREKCKVRLEEDAENPVEFPAEELTVLPKQKKSQNPPKDGGGKADEKKEKKEARNN